MNKRLGKKFCDKGRKNDRFKIKQVEIVVFCQVK